MTIRTIAEVWRGPYPHLRLLGSHQEVAVDVFGRLFVDGAYYGPEHAPYFAVEERPGSALLVLHYGRMIPRYYVIGEYPIRDDLEKWAEAANRRLRAAASESPQRVFQFPSDEPTPAGACRTDGFFGEALALEQEILEKCGQTLNRLADEAIRAFPPESYALYCRSHPKGVTIEIHRKPQP